MRAIAGLIDDIAVMKRVRAAGSEGSQADRLFLRCWQALVAGWPASRVAEAATAAALVAARLGAADLATLVGLGLDRTAALDTCRRALAASGEALLARFAPHLDAAWPDLQAPAFAARLCARPRAGATRPGHRRLVLLPAESHGDHCLLVAVGGVLLAPLHGADPAIAFLAGLAHHLHNARLPDAGFEGEALLGEHLLPLIERLRAAELATLPAALAARIEHVLAATSSADTPEGRAFNAADVIDRVQQVRYHEAAAAFRARDALEDMELVHAGPLQAFQHRVLDEAGLR